MSFVTDIFKGNSEAKAVDRATNAQTAAADRGINFVKESYETTRSDLAPYRNAGISQIAPLQSGADRIAAASAQPNPYAKSQFPQIFNSINAASSLAGQSPYTANQLSSVNRQIGDFTNLATNPQAQADFITNNPLYQVARDETLRNLSASAASKGRLGAGGTAKALQSALLELGQGFINNELSNRQSSIAAGQNFSSLADSLRQNQYNRNLGVAGARNEATSAYDTLLNQSLDRLGKGQDARMDLGKLGFTAAATTGSANAQKAASIADLLTQRGNAQSAGIIGKNDARSGMFDIGGDFIGGFFDGLLSDARYKEDAVPVGSLHDGTTVYRYRYKGDHRYHIGVMAQEIELTNPKAVTELNGVKYVNYGAL